MSDAEYPFWAAAGSKEMAEITAFVRRETFAGIGMGAFFSLLFFLLFFRLPVVPEWGAGGYVVDFVPQSFFVAFMSVLWPGLMARRALRQGTVSPVDQPSRLPRSLVPRAILLGVGAALAGVVVAGSILALAGADSLGQLVAGAVKTAWGGALAAIVTPLGLRPALTARVN